MRPVRTPTAPRAPLAAALLLLLIVPPGAAAASLELGFVAPAQARGDLASEGIRWALLVFHGPGSPGYHVRLDGPAELTNDTLLEHRRDGSTVPAGAVQARQPGTGTFGQGVEGTLRLAEHPWSSLYVEADSIRLTVPRADAQMDSSAGDRVPSSFLPRTGHPQSISSPWAAPAGGGAVVSLQGPGAMPAPLAVGLEAHGVRRVVWHNATLECEAAAGCPDPGRPWQSSMPGGMQARRLSYIGLAVPGGELAGSGDAWAVAFGGPAVDLSVTGDLRLPDAHGTGLCGDAPCADPAGRTLRATGAFTLSGLQPQPGRPGHLRAALAGEFQAAAFDEAPSPGFAAAAAAAAAVAATVGLAALAKALLGLFARSSRPPALLHPRRRELQALIKAQPGLSYRAVQRALGWPNGPLQNHLRRLVEDGAIVAQPYRDTVRYFENHGRYEGSWRPLAVLHDPRARRLHDWLGSHPGAWQTPIVAQGLDWGWSRAATQRTLRRLAEAGLVSVSRAGRRASYSALPVPPA